MSKALLLSGPLLLLGSCVASALAGDTMPGGGVSAPSLDHLLALGPYGALVWGAYLLGKGVRITIQVELSEHDREMIEKLGRAGSAIG
ncbi:MAG: hypothetical protein Q8P18_14065 [Pseudomonadota bacterium]|nr:hypothetical protein [Pseudomonadota bacterium]